MEEGCEEVGRRPGCACGAVVALISILLFALSWDTLEPTEFGLIQNGFTGSVDMRAERTFEGGRYFVWLNHHFLVFPRNLVNLEYSGRSHCPPSSYYSGMQDYDCANQGPISARTGRDDHDAESGGQPIELSVAFQYKFARRDVTRVYEKFAMMWEPSFLRFAQQAITNVAQRFTPSQFWLARHEVELAMLHEVNQTIYQEGHATVEGLQLLVVEFQPVSDRAQFGAIRRNSLTPYCPTQGVRDDDHEHPAAGAAQGDEELPEGRDARVEGGRRAAESDERRDRRDRRAGGA